MRRIWFRLRALIHRSALDAELDLELQGHIDRETRFNVARGLSPAEARRVALAAFGGVERYKEEARDAHGTRWADDFVQDARYALRSLRRAPSFTIVAVLTLALGVGANTAVFTVVNGVLLRPLPFRDPSRLVLVAYGDADNGGGNDPALSDAYYLAFRRQARSYDSITTFNSSTYTLTGAGEPVRVNGAQVTPDFFGVLGVVPALGRGFAADDGRVGSEGLVVLGDRLWRSRFAADSGVVGRTIVLDGRPHTVLGVMPAGFDFPGDKDLWTPIEVRTSANLSWRRPVVGRLKSGVTPTQARLELEAIARGFPADPSQHGRLTARVLPLSQLLVRNVQRSLLIFAGAVAFVLLIACANVANLMLMRAASRAQEMAVRATLGAGRRRLVRQLLTESALLSLIGAAVGVPLALAGTRTLLALAPPGLIPRVADIRVDGIVLAFTIAVALVTGLAFGLAPALQVSRRVLGQALGHGRRVAPRHTARNALVVSEIALSLMLLTGAGLMIRSFLRLRGVDLGFQPASVINMTVDLPDAKYPTATELHAFHDRMLAELGRVPGAVAVGAVNWRPLDAALIWGTFSVEGQPQPKFVVVKPAVTADYFRSMGIAVVAGRPFTNRDGATAPLVAIVSQSVATRLWPGENSVGKRISMEDHPKPTEWRTVVGVVADVRQQEIGEPPAVAIYLPVAQVTGVFSLQHMSFTVRTSGDPTNAARAMRAVLQAVDRDLPVLSLGDMTSLVAANRDEPLFQTRLLAAFSLMALVLAAVGVYGMLASAVSERTREIGIRIALGAESSRVRAMVVRRTLLLAAAGVALGAAGAFATTRVLSKLLFDVSTTDPATFASTALLLVAVALVAGMIPAHRATTVDPMVALRQE